MQELDKLKSGGNVGIAARKAIDFLLVSCPRPLPFAQLTHFQLVDFAHLPSHKKYVTQFRAPHRPNLQSAGGSFVRVGLHPIYCPGFKEEQTEGSCVRARFQGPNRPGRRQNTAVFGMGGGRL